MNDIALREEENCLGSRHSIMFAIWIVNTFSKVLVNSKDIVVKVGAHPVIKAMFSDVLMNMLSEIVVVGSIDLSSKTALLLAQIIQNLSKF